MTNEAREGALVSPSRLAPVIAIDLALAVGVLVLASVLWPDGGFTGISLRQGFALAAVFAAPPIAALGTRAGSSLVALGGGAMVAGAASTPGGNILGPIMALSGLLLLLVGGSAQPKLTAGTIGRLLVYAILLGAGARLALGSMALDGIPSVFLALVVGSSTHWRRLRSPPD